MCVAEAIAHRYVGRGERVEDLEQAAYVGLARVVDGFDPSLDKDFLAYAVPTISGVMEKYFRDCCWTVRPPRRIQELQPHVFGCVATLTQRLGRAPRLSEIAEELDIDRDDVVEASCADGCYAPTSLDIAVGDSGSASIGELLGVGKPGFSRADIHLLLGPLIRALVGRDRDIVMLRFYDDWTQQQIATEFGITQTQVSRLLSRIMRQLRERIG